MKDKSIHHVYPVDDLIEHFTDGTPCPCNPKVAEKGRLVIHNAFDQREKIEEYRASLKVILDTAMMRSKDSSARRALMLIRRNCHEAGLLK